MGSGWRFLDNSVLVFLAWIYMMRSVRPLVIIHECTPLFPYKVFELLLNTGISDPQQHYTVNSMISCSTSLGVPCKRKRRYTVLRCNCSAGAFTTRPFSEKHFHEVAAVPLELDGLVFFRDSRDAVADHKAYFAREVSMVASSCNGVPWSWRALLSASQMARLREVCKWRRTSCTDDGVFLSLAQGISHQPYSLDRRVPTLIQNSLIYFCHPDEFRDRMATPLEYYGMQLFPVMLPTGHWAKDIEFDEILSRSGMLEFNRARRLCGNGMSVVSIGKLLAYVLGTTHMVAQGIFEDTEGIQSLPEFG